MRTPGPLTQKYIKDLTFEQNVIDQNLTTVNKRLAEANQSLLNFQVNKPGALEKLHDLKLTARQANAKVESNHWDYKTRYRYASEARWAEGGVKHHLNTYPGLAEADRYYNEIPQLRTAHRRLLAYRKDIIDAISEVENFMSNLHRVRR